MLNINEIIYDGLSLEQEQIRYNYLLFDFYLTFDNDPLT